MEFKMEWRSAGCSHALFHKRRISFTKEHGPDRKDPCIIQRRVFFLEMVLSVRTRLLHLLYLLKQFHGLPFNYCQDVKHICTQCCRQQALWKQTVFHCLLSLRNAILPPRCLQRVMHSLAVPALATYFRRAWHFISFLSPMPINGLVSSLDLMSRTGGDKLYPLLFSKL